MAESHLPGMYFYLSSDLGRRCARRRDDGSGVGYNIILFAFVVGWKLERHCMNQMGMQSLKIYTLLEKPQHLHNK